MEEICVIGGSGKISREKINLLLDPAIEFYGSKYEPIILDVVKNTCIYEMSPHEDMKKVILDISGNRRLNLNYKMPKACHLTLRFLGDIPLNAVIWRPEYCDLDYAILAHELFGHSVCGRKKVMIDENFTRNGISLHRIQTGKDKLELLNEGFMEWITESILKNTNRNIRVNQSKKYYSALICARYIEKILGKSLVLDDLIEYYGLIEKEYNKNCGNHSLDLLEQLLRSDAHKKVIFSARSLKLSKKISKELLEFRKRKSVIR